MIYSSTNQAARLDGGVARAAGLPRRVHLVRAHVSLSVRNLAVQVAQLDDVPVHNAQAPHARRGQVKRRRAAQAARADD